MKPATLLALLRGDMRAALATLGPVRQAQRIAFLAAAGEAGVLARLRAGPATRDEIAAVLGAGADPDDALASWLSIGVQVGDLALRDGRYALRSRLARRLADPRHAAVLGIVEQSAGLYHRVIREAPARLRSGAKLTLADVDGALVARASRVVEPLLFEAVDEVVPPRGAFRLLEVGCGSATYVRHAAARNPELTALALDLDERVVAEARASCAAWGIADRVEVARGDVLARAPEPRFDLVTLHNLVYYFPVAAREALFAKLLAFARPGGALLVTATCRGGSLVSDVLSLWGASTEGCGRLPDADELARQIAAAGWRDPDARRLLPGDSLYRFVARAG
jgi:SAM-dependent methyltransferase